MAIYRPKFLEMQGEKEVILGVSLAHEVWVRNKLEFGTHISEFGNRRIKLGKPNNLLLTEVKVGGGYQVLVEVEDQESYMYTEVVQTAEVHQESVTIDGKITLSP